MNHQTVTTALKPITDLMEWPQDAIMQHRTFYKAEARYDPIWNQRVEELQAEIERRCKEGRWYHN